MKPKSFAQRYLEQLEWLDARIECMVRERNQWERRAAAVRGDAGEKCREYARELLEQVQALREKQVQVAAVLEKMDNPTWYKLLYQRYLLKMPLSQIADSFGADYTWVTTTHGRAMQGLEKILRKNKCDFCDEMP